MVSTDSPAGPVGMRILVAANKASSAKSVAKFLNDSNSVVTCTSKTKLLGLLRRQAFDFVVAEADASADSTTATLNGLELLDLDFVPPIVLAMDQLDKQAVCSAVKRGAAGIIGLPMCKQRAQLSSVWCQGLCKRVKSSPSEASKGSSSSDTDLEFPELLSAEDTVQDFIFSLDDLELEPLDCEPEAEGEIEPLLTIAGTFLEQAATSGSSMEDNLTIAEAFQTDEAVSAVMPTSASYSEAQDGRDLKRPYSEICKDEPSSEDNTVKLETGSAMSDDVSSELCGFEDESSDEKMKNSKKVKVEWTQELHVKFLEAVETLGPDKAVPSRILEYMGTANPALTRQNIASHLQKYRHSRRGRSSDSSSSLNPAGAAARAVQSFLPILPGNIPVSMAAPVASQGGIFINPAAGAGTSRSSSPVQQQWVHPLQLWNPWQGTVMYNQLGQPIVSQPVPAPRVCQFPATVSGGSSQDVQKAIQDVLSQPKNKGPLGLSLDQADLLKHLKGAAGKEASAANASA
mmetsp:Transcript_24909/g.69447  ORF Transcript_24909/g.69447 Transcript_24909/m.69447 type:complete len:516 (-) Transcript_24909:351-1898(-)